MLGTRTTELESHNFRGPSCSTRNTAAPCWPWKWRHMQKKWSASSSAFPLQLSECIEILLNSESSSLSQIISVFGFLFFLRSAWMKKNNSCFLATALVCVLFRGFHWVMFVNWRNIITATLPPLRCPLLVRFSNSWRSQIISRQCLKLTSTVHFEAPH